MPHKFNADRRHKIAKKKFKVTNWAAYNESLRQRALLHGSPQTLNQVFILFTRCL